MKFPTVVLASCLFLIGFTTSTPTTKSQMTTTLTTTYTSLPKTTTKTTTTSTKVLSTSTKTSSATSKATNYDINFDDRKVLDPLMPALGPVGVEDTILFNAWVVSKRSSTDGVVPHSQPNAAATDVLEQLTNGTPSLTALYPGSPIKSFDFYDFWFGCVANTADNAGVNLATPCTISLGGFRGGQQVANSSFTFTPPSVTVGAPMIHAVLPNTFMDVENVTIVQQDPALQILETDDYNITTHT